MHTELLEFLSEGVLPPSCGISRFKVVFLITDTHTHTYRRSTTGKNPHMHTGLHTHTNIRPYTFKRGKKKKKKINSACETYRITLIVFQITPVSAAFPLLNNSYSSFPHKPHHHLRWGERKVKER